MNKGITEYKMDVHFVDSTYWDDGSRYTKRTFTFQTEKEAVQAKKEILKSGIKFTSSISGKTDIKYIYDEEDIKIYKITTEKIVGE